MSNNTKRSQEENFRITQLGMRAYADQSRAAGLTDQIPFDVMDRGEIIEVTPDGRTIIDLEVDKKYQNLAGYMHGAATSAIFDCYTTVAFGQYLPYWSKDMHQQGIPGGVSRNLTITYLRPVTIPTKIRVTSEVMAYGKTANYVRATMTSADGKKLYATCEHHKYQPPPTSKGSGKTSKL